MLAISETLALQSGLDWAFCDTDSMAIAKPVEMDDQTFYSRAKAVGSVICGRTRSARISPATARDSVSRRRRPKNLGPDQWAPVISRAIMDREG
jgi:hypothetical protein